MRTIAIKFKMRWKLEFNALLETGKRKPLRSGIKSIGASWEMALLRESEDKAEFSELLFDTEEAKVIGVDFREFVGSMFQGEREHFDLLPFDVVREIGTRTFNTHPGFFSWNKAGRVFNAIENAVSDFLNDVVDGNRSAGILETMAAMIASV
jgi:hypothetical protein